MIERIIAASVRNRFLVFVFTLFAIVAGIYTLKRAPLDAIPDLSDVQVTVYTEWEGRSLHRIHCRSESQICPWRIDVR